MDDWGAHNNEKLNEESCSTWGPGPASLHLTAWIVSATQKGSLLKCIKCCKDDKCCASAIAYTSGSASTFQIYFTYGFKYEIWKLNMKSTTMFRLHLNQTEKAPVLWTWCVTSGSVPHPQATSIKFLCNVHMTIFFKNSIHTVFVQVCPLCHMFALLKDPSHTYPAGFQFWLIHLVFVNLPDKLSSKFVYDIISFQIIYSYEYLLAICNQI